MHSHGTSQTIQYHNTNTAERKEEKRMSVFDKMVKFMDLSWPVRDVIVPCLVGPPGIGKTAAVEQHVRNLGHGKMVKIVASRCIPSETVGMTMPDHEHHSMDIYNSRQLSSLEDGDVLFFDELLEADQFVLSTLLTLIESREMADGTPLPDIQIIAATNDTIPSSQLKDNIKQRFMFNYFSLDKQGTREYIKEKTGLDLSDEVIARLESKSDGREYNFLSPRTLTKLATWMAEAPESDLYDITSIINNMFDIGIGSYLREARDARDARQKEEEVKAQIKELVSDDELSGIDIDGMSIGEVAKFLMGLPDWEEISQALSNIDMG
jgi:MoxR-like ATPase